MVAVTQLRGTKLEDLPDEEFRKLVDRELRRGHINTSPREQVELKTISQKLRHPAVIDRWISVLEIMKSSSEAQLGAKRSDLKKVHGTVPEAEYQSRLREYEAWRAGNVRFLNSVQERLIETRYVKLRLFGLEQPVRLEVERNQAMQALLTFKVAIESHRSTVLSEDYEPTDADTALWSVVSRPKE